MKQEWTIIALDEGRYSTAPKKAKTSNYTVQWVVKEERKEQAEQWGEEEVHPAALVRCRIN